MDQSLSCLCPRAIVSEILIGYSVVMALVLASAFGMCGCASWTQRDCYVGGPCVVKTTEANMQNHCHKPGQVNDHGTPILASQIAACYDKGAKEIWLAWDNLDAVFHELCHYFCSPDKITTCDIRCDLHNEEPYKYTLGRIK